MTFDPYVKVEDIVVLVTDKNHPDFGELGSLIYHDWMEYGKYLISIPKKGSYEVPDGLCKGDPLSPVRLFYRHGGFIGSLFGQTNTSLDDLKNLYTESRMGNLESLARKYETVFGQKMPEI